MPAETLAWHTLEPRELFEALETTGVGQSEAEAEKRLRETGRNTLPQIM